MVTRTLRRGLPAALLVVVGLVIGGLASPAAAEIERDNKFVLAVNASIDRGVAFLRERQLETGAWAPHRGQRLGNTALVYHTLRTCGVPASDPALEKAWAWMMTEYPEVRADKHRRTYSMALLLMALEDRGRVGGAPKPGEEPEVRLTKEERELGQELVDFLVNEQSANGSWSYADPNRMSGPPPTRYDHSNMQYALLGLKAASRCDLKIPTEPLKRAFDHLIAAQEVDGPEVVTLEERGRGRSAVARRDRARGWSYYSLDPKTKRPEAAAYGSMTAGGLGAVVICRSELIGRRGYGRKDDRAAETAIRDGLAWLATHFTVRENPGKGAHHNYYLYSLERAGMLAGVERFGEHDWYGEGARRLMDEQDGNGRWIENPAVTNTCFALLFLKKGTIPVRRGAITPSDD